MKPQFDIYRSARRYDNAKRNLEASTIIDSADKTAILGFVRQIQLNGVGKARATKYLVHLTVLARNKPIPFQQLTRKEVEDLVGWLNNQPYTNHTRHDYLVILKKFFQWLKGSNVEDNEYPNEVKWIRTRFRKTRLLPETLITREELEKLIEAAENPRDRALILTHYESGCRIGEVLSLRLENIEFDNHGAVLIVNGKTGARRVRIIAAAPALANWLSIHPLRKDPTAHAWLGVGTVGRNLPLEYESVRRIYKRLSKKAGIEKRVYTHLFRHSRATQLASILTEAQLKEHLGWVQDSKMASNYVHLSGRDIDKALLRAHGLTADQEQSPELIPLTCQNCHQKISPGVSHCPNCGRPAVAATDNSSAMSNVATALISDKEFLTFLERKLREIVHEHHHENHA